MKFFLQVNDLQMKKTFNKTPIFKKKQRNLKSQQTYITQYVSTTISINSYFEDTIQAMFYLSDQIFKDVCTPTDKICEKQHTILNQVREIKLSDYYKHLDTKLQEMFARYDDGSNKFDQMFGRGKKLLKIYKKR